MEKIVRSFSRFCFLLLAMVFVLGLVGLPQASAQEYWEEPVEVLESGDYSYTLRDDETAVIVDYSGDEADVEIPAELDGYAVSEIADQAFSYYEMTSLVIPKGVIVGSRAFEYCVITDSLTLPEEIVIRGRAFNYAELPHALMVPEGAVLEGESFSYCEDLKVLFLAPQVTVKKSAFSYSEDLESIVCASGSSITERAFYSCDRLGDVVLCGNVELGEKPFPYSRGVKIIEAEEEDFANAAQGAMEIAEQPNIQGGTVNGRVYENDSLELMCRLPKAFTVTAWDTLLAGEEDPDDVDGQDLAAYLQDHSSWIDMLAESGSGDSISVIVTAIPEEGKEILDILLPEELAAMQGYSAVSMLVERGFRDISFAVDTDYDEFPADDCGCLYFTASVDDIPVFIREVLFTADDYMVTVTATAYGEDSTLDYLSYFG